ncbi:TetR/AcrR family transcriptional regulator [Allokutzneria sp. A3M-2-11 16]|uniref:TetR/AcrR family transcriptional regulator n=1 Tax=Allokutzneria sp. A3M-2-11 16 TaxID=2962043 RepID=UPI0020B66BD0|nr:TetR/AcrR family transcriptional regulator [Allokutzneria sp. A3M-2-11 16]MCP3797854.1 TetR/AcrR family transcriptional regulator [Allokutzneria sp. A3M-2-11 16]
MAELPTDVWRNLPAAKRERVLAAALDEFAALGYSRGSLNVIAREAGIAKGSLFQYFHDKLDLFATAAEVVSLRVRAAIEPRLGQLGSPDFAEFVVDALDVWVRWFAEHPVERGVTAATNLEMDPVVRAAVRDVAHRHYLEVLRPLVIAAVERGELDADPDVVIAWLMLLVPHLALAPFLPGLDPVFGLHGAPPETIRDTVRRLLAPLLGGKA